MSQRREDPDRSLMARVEARDADALAELYDRHAGRLLGLSRRILGDGGEAEEVLQEVFLFAWRSASSFDPARGKVLTWLLIATRSRSIDRLRARRPASRPEIRSLEEVAEGPAGPDDVEAASSGKQWESICRAAVGELPEDQRRRLRARVLRRTDASGDRGADLDAAGHRQDPGSAGIDETSGADAPVLGEW